MTTVHAKMFLLLTFSGLSTVYPNTWIVPDKARVDRINSISLKLKIVGRLIENTVSYGSTFRTKIMLTHHRDI